MTLKELDEKYYSARQVGEMFGLSPSRIYQFHRDDRLKGEQILGRWYYTKESVDSLKEARSKPQAVKAAAAAVPVGYHFTPRRRKVAAYQCPYCLHRPMPSKGFGLHLNKKHPEVWEVGHKEWPNVRSCEWPYLGTEAEKAAWEKAMTEKLQKDEYRVQVREAKNGNVYRASKIPKRRRADLETKWVEGEVLEGEFVETIAPIVEVTKWNDNEPVFTIAAANKFAIPLLTRYMAILPLGVEQNRVAEMIDLIAEWQVKNRDKVKVPFTGGKGD